MAGGDGLEQVADGAGELPFRAGFGLAAHRQMAQAHVVPDMAVRGLGDVAALAVSLDPVFGFQPLIPVHRTVPLRHPPTLSNPGTHRTPTRRDSATPRPAT